MPETEATARRIEAVLRSNLEPIHLDVEDESWQHQGHAGAASGGGHFSVLVVSHAFTGKSLVERHKIVYDAVGDLMKDIHALAIRAVAPPDWKND